MSTPVEITWLLAAVAKGDALAFERLYGATCPKLYGVVLRILRRHDLASGVLEQAYLQIWREAGDYDPARLTPLAWMVAIVRRLAIDAARAPQPPATDGEPEITEESIVKKYVLLHYGFEKPTPEVMSAWGKWFESIKDRIIDMGGHFSSGREVSKNGTRDLPLGLESITGFTIVSADSLDDAEKIARGNPYISSIRVYEVRSK